MPNAALLALTSPLLLAQAPEAALDPTVRPIPNFDSALVIEADRVARFDTMGVMDVSWSLVAMQPGEGTPGEGQSSDDPPAEEGQIVVEGSYGPPEADPMERINEESYRITQDIDEVFVGPIAYAYRDGLPGPLRDGLGNFVRNLGEPNNALNFLLQGKVGKSLASLGRLAINSTFGLAGLIDIAGKPGIGIPYRRNGWANTMGFYGVGPGPYLYLPVTGATTARDVVGSGLDQLLLPVAVGAPFNKPEFTIPYFVVDSLDSRLEVDEELERIGETLNPYAARRDTYLYRRARTIAELKGEEPPEPPAILEEVEGTGDFADPPEGGSDNFSEGSAADAVVAAPKVAVIITRPRQGE